MPVRIGTAEHNSTFLSQGLALKQVLDRNPALAPVEILETAQASMQNAKRLHAGELDFGFMAANWIGRAKDGTAPFTEAIDLRMAAPMNAGPLFFIARADSGLRTVADLRGKRIAFGLRTSGMAQHAVVILNALGVAAAEVEPHYLDFAEGAAALVAGAIDAQLQCPIPNKVMTELSESSAIRVLPYPEGELARLLATVPYYRRTVMRAGALRGLDANVAQPAVVNVLATHARTSDAVVRDVVAAVIANASELAERNALFVGLDDLIRNLASGGRAQFEFGGVPLHPGALTAYREAGLLA
jgi:TRAP transporter TAXI family solute receptor